MSIFTERKHRAMNRIQRLVFGEVAELYDQRRPSYPEALVEDVCPEPVDALEVGAGTGKATVLFAPRVASLVAIEPSAEMGEVLAQRLGALAGAAFPRVVKSDFESFEPGEQRFGLIYSAQAWHWVDAARRAGRAAELLAPGGVLAAFWNRPVWSPGPLRDRAGHGAGAARARAAGRPDRPLGHRAPRRDVGDLGAGGRGRPACYRGPS